MVHSMTAACYIMVSSASYIVIATWFDYVIKTLAHVFVITITITIYNYMKDSLLPWACHGHQLIIIWYRALCIDGQVYMWVKIWCKLYIWAIIHSWIQGGHHLSYKICGQIYMYVGNQTNFSNIKKELSTCSHPYTVKYTEKTEYLQSSIHSWIYRKTEYLQSPMHN